MLEKYVALLLITKIPQRTGTLTAVLQRRGCWDTEKERPETYPNCCQTTVYGKIRRIKGEVFEFPMDTLLRLCSEELGWYFKRTCIPDITLLELKPRKFVDEDNKEIETFSWTAAISAEDIKKIHLSSNTGGIVMLTEEMIDDIVSIPSEKSDERMKRFGPELTHSIAMFPNQIDVVKDSFKIFKRMK